MPTPPFVPDFSDPNLTDIANCLQYNTTSGKPEIRANIADGINISGTVNIPGTITVDSSPSDPVHVHASNEAGSAFHVTVDNPVTSVTATISGTPSVSAAVTSMPEVEVKNDSGNPLSISANTTTNSNTNPIYVKGTSDISFFSPTQSDAFGRLRVSNPYTLADYFNRYQDNSGSFNSTVGGGSVGFNTNSAAVTLSVGTTSGDAVYRETSKVFAYQPGKSLLILQTFTMASAKTNLTQRVGYFDTANGYYLEQVGSTVYLVERSSVTGSLVETRVAQASWNVNTLGTLDLSKSQILWTDVEWLGVGSVRMGFVINGEFVHCHTFHHANIITGTYITTACLPMRREIFNTGTTSSSSTMQSICASVISEGGYDFKGREFCQGHTLGSPVSLPNDLSFKPIMSIRLKSDRPGAIVLPTTYNVTPVQQSVYKYQIYRRAITTGGSWVSAGSTSSVEYKLSPATISSGEVATSAFINSSNQSSGVATMLELGFDYQLERDTFTPTMYEFVIAVASSTNSTSVYGSINWKEIT